ncbi:MAG: HAMP domain-containing histidine kinase [Saprospiraceae bacterium]|nr:HAMP domain-containing histidine kinase [Saprospiraceae bacterium]
MSRRAIWIVIGLMAIALIGTAIVQLYWINWSVNLKEEQFNESIIASLHRVAAKLEKHDPSVNFSSTFLLEEWNEKQKQIELIDREIRLQKYPLEKRIDPLFLRKILMQEFDDMNLDLDYSFGVFDNFRNRMIILNGFYQADVGEHTRASDPGFSLETLLQNSEYEVALFTSISGSPGSLKIFFPSKTTWLWRSVWPLAVLGLLLIILIVVCFSYVVIVIFRQKKLSEIKNDFVNNMTHEFKTPIATISLASDSICSPTIINTPDKIKRFVDIIKQENRRMLSQVEKVLQMALLDKHDFKLNLKSLNLHDIINQAVANIDLQVQQREGILETSLEALNPIVMGDPVHMTNIIYNLLDNANKYSPEKPEISIKTKNKGAFIEVIVTDKGIGMSRDSQKLVFEKFYRVPTGNIHDVKGFGLGLSYVKAMAIAHSGKVELHSELGKGSTFTLTFPLAPQP